MVRRNAGRSDLGVTRTGAAVRAIMWAAIAAWTLAASPGSAATVSEVRVGTHDDGHTRIVVELDSMAGYRLQSPSPGAPELVVQLDASSISRDVPSKSKVVKKVHVEPGSGGASTVRISLATGDVAVKEMLLSNPPRIVLDLKARGPLPKEVAEAAPDAAQNDVDETPEKVAVAPPVPVAPPAPAKVEAPKAEPVVVAAAEPAAQKSAAAPPASSKLTMPSSPAPAPLKDDAMPPPPTAPQPDADEAPSTAPSAAAEPAAKPALIPPIDREKHLAPPPTPSTPAPATASNAAARRDAIAAKTQPSTGGDSLLDLALSPIGMGAIGAVVLLLLVVVVMRRRRGAEDEDPLYTVMSADDAGAAVSMDDAYPATEAAARPPVLSSLGPYEPEPYEDASEPVFKPDATGRQMTLGSEPAAEAAERETPEMSADDSDSIFGGEPEPAVAAPPAPVAMPAPTPEPIAAPAVSQVAQISAEVERRVAELERRLEQLTEARERLERQVAAQTEELRVQRAAIARTQRVVRTIAKTEDMATEPVPRAPSA
jgi:hypothetical protein